MDPNWAVENLQVIRTLMERSAVYRRALAPVMLLIGVMGAGAAILGVVLGFDTPRAFVLHWMGTSAISIAAAMILVRRQALHEGEPFWSPPMRRVSEAFAPPLLVGCAAGLAAGLARDAEPDIVVWLPPVWMALFGCALHAAGFFMKRGIKLFGWVFLVCSFGVLATHAGIGPVPAARTGHMLMGATFGGLHIAYSVYLYFSESRKNEL